MGSSLTKVLAALALAGVSVPAIAQDYPPATSAAASQAPQGIGLWFGVIMTLVVAGVVIFHEDLFDDDDDEAPVSP